MQIVRQKNMPLLLGILLIFSLVLSACGEPALTEDSLHVEGDAHAEDSADHAEGEAAHNEGEAAHSEESEAAAEEGDTHAEDEAAHSEEAEASAQEGEAQMAEETHAETEGEVAEGEHMETEAMHAEEGGMMHAHVDVPAEFAELENPYAGSEEAAAEGAAIFATACTVCHGENGEGDGPGAAALEPKPANLSDAAMMGELSDAYIFWRITKGGNMDPFNSAMPSWEAAYTESQRWQLATYVRSLSQ